MSTLATVKKTELADISNEINRAVKRVLGKHGMSRDLEIVTSTEADRKDASLNFNVHIGEQQAAPAGGVAQEIAESTPQNVTARNRFLANHKQVGLRKSDLYSLKKYRGSLYYIIGLKGKANRIVVARKSNKEQFVLDPVDFRQRATSA